MTLRGRVGYRSELTATHERLALIDGVLAGRDCDATWETDDVVPAPMPLM